MGNEENMSDLNKHTRSACIQFVFFLFLRLFLQFELKLNPGEAGAI